MYTYKHNPFTQKWKSCVQKFLVARSVNINGLCCNNCKKIVSDFHSLDITYSDNLFDRHCDTIFS